MTTFNKCLTGIWIYLTIVQCHGPYTPQIVVFTSSIEGDRLKRQSDLSFRQDLLSDLPVITLDEKVEFQKIDGFGASFNEAGMICLNSLNQNSQDAVLSALFSPDSGAGFSLMKSPIAACDFASAGPWYSYNDTPGDTLMKNFNIERDLGPNGLVTFIKRAQEFGQFEIESPMDFAPDWMYYSLKKGEKHIKPEYYNALARYYSLYIQAYQAKGIAVNYLNLFNEAENEWYSNVTYKEIGKMIKYHVAPRFAADGLPVKIQLGETAFRPEALKKFPSAIDDPEVKQHISHFTVHGYDWDKFSALSELHEKYPEIPIWMTEICFVSKTHFPENGPQKSPVFEFSNGEFWGNMIINDLKNWVSGWIYWNMILDQNGGPWLVSPEHGDPDDNQQHAVVIINRETGEVTYTGLYYYLAHFSRFVRPGAARISSTGGTDKLNFVAFRNPDDTITLVILNNNEQIDCGISWNGRTTTCHLKPHSITTLNWTYPKEY